MVTRSWKDREWGGAKSGSSHVRAPRGWRPVRMGVLGLAGLAGCLDMLGDVNVDDVGQAIAPNLPLPEDCTEAAIAAGTCVVSCAPETSRCSAHLLQRCNAAGNAWTLLDQCASAALCNAEAARCDPPPCTVGEHRCTENGELQVCRADRTGYELREACRSAAFCITEPGRERCAETECRAGRQRCNGAQIEECRADRSGFDPVGAPCGSAALCVEGETEFPSCDPSVCVPGVFTCQGRQLSRCADDALSDMPISECATPELCLVAEQRCGEPACAVGAQRCTGAVLERCNDGRTAFAAVETCSSVAACNPAAAQCSSVALPPPPDPDVLDGPDYDIERADREAVLGLSLRLDVPQEWSDIDQAAWTDAAGAVIGPRFVASTDAARFSARFDIPGVFFSATAQAPLDVPTRQASFDLTGLCTKGALAPYEDDLYEGTTQTWTSCGTTNGTTDVVVATPKEGTAFVLVVIVTMLADRDEEAKTAVWDSFEVR